MVYIHLVVIYGADEASEYYIIVNEVKELAKTRQVCDKFFCHRNVIENAFNNLYDQYGDSVVRVSLHGMASGPFLKAMEKLKNVTTFFCRGFEMEALTFLTFFPNSVVSKIKRLGFFNLVLPSDYKRMLMGCFPRVTELNILFTGSDHINVTELRRQCAGLRAPFEEIKVKLFTGHGSNASTPIQDFSFLSSYCGKMKFKGIVNGQTRQFEEIIAKIPNLRHLDLDLENIDDDRLHNLFQKINIYDINHVVLRNMRYGKKAIEAICSRAPGTCRLISLELFDVRSIDHTAAPISHIIPENLLILCLQRTRFTKYDLGRIVERCRDLSHFEFMPTVQSDQFSFTHPRDAGWNLLEVGIPEPLITDQLPSATSLDCEPHSIAHALQILPLIHFSTKSLFRRTFLYTLCNNLFHLYSCEFHICCIDPDATKEILDIFYTSVEIKEVHRDYVNNHRDLEDEHDVKIGQWITKVPVHDVPDDENTCSRCHRFHIIVEGPKKVRPFISDLVNACFLPLCDCRHSTSIKRRRRPRSQRVVLNRLAVEVRSPNASDADLALARSNARKSSIAKARSAIAKRSRMETAEAQALTASLMRGSRDPPLQRRDDIVFTYIDKNGVRYTNPLPSIAAARGDFNCDGKHYMADDEDSSGRELVIHSTGPSAESTDYDDDGPSTSSAALKKEDDPVEPKKLPICPTEITKATPVARPFRQPPELAPLPESLTRILRKLQARNAFLIAQQKQMETTGESCSAESTQPLGGIVFQPDGQVVFQPDAQRSVQPDAQIMAQVLADANAQLGCQAYAQLGTQPNSQLISELITHPNAQLLAQLVVQIESQLEERFQEHLERYENSGSPVQIPPYGPANDQPAAEAEDIPEAVVDDHESESQLENDVDFDSEPTTEQDDMMDGQLDAEPEEPENERNIHLAGQAGSSTGQVGGAPDLAMDGPGQPGGSAGPSDMDHDRTKRSTDKTKESDGDSEGTVAVPKKRPKYCYNCQGSSQPETVRLLQNMLWASEGERAGPGTSSGTPEWKQSLCDECILAPPEIMTNFFGNRRRSNQEPTNVVDLPEGSDQPLVPNSSSDGNSQDGIPDVLETNAANERRRRRIPVNFSSAERARMRRLRHAPRHLREGAAAVAGVENVGEVMHPEMPESETTASSSSEAHDAEGHLFSDFDPNDIPNGYGEAAQNGRE